MKTYQHYNQRIIEGKRSTALEAAFLFCDICWVFNNFKPTFSLDDTIQKDTKNVRCYIDMEGLPEEEDFSAWLTKWAKAFDIKVID